MAEAADKPEADAKCRGRERAAMRVEVEAIAKTHHGLCSVHSELWHREASSAVGMFCA